MIPGDRLVVAFIKPLGIGATFKTWPLHVTLVPWFRVHVPTEDMVVDLHKRFEHIPPFEVNVDGEGHFGHKGSKLVSLIQLPSPLQHIERRVRVYLHLQGAWIVDETTKVRRSFQPHVTVQGNERMQSGDRFMCSRLAVVEQKGEFKEVVGIIRLHDNER